MGTKRVAGGRFPRRLTVSSDLTGLSAVLYGRKSTPDPRNPGKSIEDQLGALDVQAERRGLLVVARLDDPSKGASKYSRAKVREAFEQIIGLIRTQPIAVLGLWEMSRATRRLRIFGELMELCEDRGVLILLQDRLYDPRDNRDRMTLGIQAVMDENEVSIGRERTLRGIASAAAMGHPHGRSLYGYRRVYDERTGRLVRVEIDPQQGAVIKEIAERVLNGETSKAIARDLTARGVPRPDGARWYAAGIRTILTNPAYVGKRVHVRQETGERVVYDAAWPQILEPEDFAALAQMFAARSQGEYTTNPKYVLTGIVVCGRCQDEVMYVEGSRPARPATATRRARGPLAAAYKCQACKRTRNQDALERYVLDTMNKWLSDPAFRDAELADAQADAAVSGDRRALQQARTDLAQAEADLASGDISPRAFTITERRLLPLIATLDRRVAAAEVPGSAMAAYLAQGAPPLADMTLGEQRETLKSFIRVRCLASPRGRGFDPVSVEILPLRVWRAEQTRARRQALAQG